MRDRVAEPTRCVRDPSVSVDEAFANILSCTRHCLEDVLAGLYRPVERGADVLTGVAHRKKRPAREVAAHLPGRAERTLQHVPEGPHRGEHRIYHPAQRDVALGRDLIEKIGHPDAGPERRAGERHRALIDSLERLSDELSKDCARLKGKAHDLAQ